MRRGNNFAFLKKAQPTAPVAPTNKVKGANHHEDNISEDSDKVVAIEEEEKVAYNNINVTTNQFDT